MSGWFSPNGTFHSWCMIIIVVAWSLQSLARQEEKKKWLFSGVNTLKGQEIHIHFLASRLDSIFCRQVEQKIFKYHADPGNARQYLKSSVCLPRAPLQSPQAQPHVTGLDSHCHSNGVLGSRPGFRLTGAWPLQSTVVYRNVEFFNS
jgi:hypothetical protein